jgi:hypothetical protein
MAVDSFITAICGIDPPPHWTLKVIMDLRDLLAVTIFHQQKMTKVLLPDGAILMRVVKLEGGKIKSRG